MKIYTYEYLLRQSVHSLRAILRGEFGGVPRLMNKENLIKEIMSIQAGETTPKRSPRGRKPIQNYSETKEIELPYVDELDFSDVEDNATFRKEGLVEIRKDNYAFLHDLDGSFSTSDFYIMPEIVGKFNLKHGDIIECESRKDAKTGLVMVEKVFSINGVSPAKKHERINITDFSPRYPTEKISLYKNCESEMFKRIDLICPIGKGQRCLIGMEKFAQPDFIKELVKSICKNGGFDVNVLLCGVKPEDVTDFNDIIGCNYTVVDTHENESKSVRKIGLFFEKNHRLVERGRNVVSIVCFMNSVIGVYDRFVNLNDEIPVFSNGNRFINHYFSTSGNFLDQGSLTFIGVMATDFKDENYEDLLKFATCEIRINQKRGKSSIDVLNSYTVKDDLLLTEAEAELAEEIRKSNL